jgi:hypothetical protein
MSPEGGISLLAFHYPQLATQISGSTPTIVMIHQLPSPQPTQPKEWDPSSLPHNPLGLPTSLKGFIALDWLGISYLGDPKTLIYYRNAHNILLNAID